MLATGARIGEILAVRWEDADLAAEHPVLTICGTIIYIKGKGFWRAARADTGLEWVTPHTFRKTVATLIDKEANTDSAAAQLGHGSKEITKKHYIVKPALAPDSSAILEQLGARSESGDPEPGDPDHARTA